MNKDNFKTPQELIESWEEKAQSEAQPRIVLNSIRTPDGTVLVSRHRHDFVVYKDANGLEYMVDGGLSYFRRYVQNDAPYEELSVTDEAPFEQIREAFHWGTYGKDGKDKLRRVALCDMSNEHIEAILNIEKLDKWVRGLMRQELEYRKEKNIIIND